jgi:hypothetical protein
MPRSRHVSRESDAVISPAGSESSNIMKLLRRAMDACGIAITDARWTYMRLFCSYCNLRGQLWRPKVARAMAVIVADDQELRDANDVSLPDTVSFRLRVEITKLRHRMAMFAASDTMYHVDRAVAMEGGSQLVDAENDE